MKNVTLMFIVLAACSSESKPRNLAVAFATFVDPGAPCRVLGTGAQGTADTAVCRIGGALVYCVAGPGVDPGCKPFGNVPQPQPQPQAQAPTSESPPPPRPPQQPQPAFTPPPPPPMLEAPVK